MPADVDAMVCHPVLGVVVGADLFGTHAATDCTFSLAIDLG